MQSSRDEARDVGVGPQLPLDPFAPNTEVDADYEARWLAPDTARSYERADPFSETGHHGMDRHDCPPSRRADEMIRAVHNAHESHQLNSESHVRAGDANVL